MDLTPNKDARSYAIALSDPEGLSDGRGAVVTKALYLQRRRHLRSRRSVFGFGIGRKRREDLNRTTPVQAVGIKLWPLVVSREGGD